MRHAKLKSYVGIVEQLISESILWARNVPVPKLSRPAADRDFVIFAPTTACARMKKINFNEHALALSTRVGLLRYWMVYTYITADQKIVIGFEKRELDQGIE